MTRQYIVKETEIYDELIKGCLNNDRKYQRQLYDTFASEMLVVCSLYAHNQQEAEDVMIEGFMLVFNNLSSFRGECSLKTWIRKIMTNKAIANYRNNRRKYENLPIEDESILGIHCNDDIETKMTGKEVMKIIQEMPEMMKMVFNLHFFEECTFNEIGKELQISENNARLTFFRAKNWLIQKIDKEQ